MVYMHVITMSTKIPLLSRYAEHVPEKGDHIIIDGSVFFVEMRKWEFSGQFPMVILSVTRSE